MREQSAAYAGIQSYHQDTSGDGVPAGCHSPGDRFASTTAVEVAE